MKLKRNESGKFVELDEQMFTTLSIKRYSPKVSLGEYYMLLNFDDPDIAEKAREYCLSLRSKYKKWLLGCGFEKSGISGYPKQGFIDLGSVDNVNVNNYKKVVDDALKKLNKQKRNVIDKRLKDMTRGEREKFKAWEMENLRRK